MAMIISITKQERMALLFLSGVILCGSVIRYALKINPRLFHYIDHLDKLPAAVKLDINTATRQQLIDLPDIGETMADRIISYREKKGSVATLDDLRKIKGMTERRISNIKGYLKGITKKRSTRALEH
jgi:competence ComEA-like helix-hairpin-helix protein